MNKRLNAFTLMEITVAMLVTALVISVSYSAYIIISKSFSAYTVKQNEIAALLSLDKLLKKDFDRAGMIDHTDGGVMLRDAERVVNYTFLPKMVIREAGIRDTFKVNVVNWTFLFENRTVTGMETSSTVDEISFDVRYHNEIVPFHYYKQYSSAELVTPLKMQSADLRDQKNL